MATPPRTRITAPGALRVAIVGIMAVSDDFGRLRIAVSDARALAAAIPKKFGHAMPYEFDGSAGGERGQGVVWLNAPARYRAHWEAQAASLRGKAVRAEATVRPYMSAGRQGFALDLSMLEEVAAAAQ